MRRRAFRIKNRDGYTNVEKICISYAKGDVVDKVLPGTSWQRQKGNLVWRKSRLTGHHLLVAARDFEYWYTSKRCYNCFGWSCKQYMDRGYCKKVAKH